MLLTTALLQPKIIINFTAETVWH